MDFVSSKVSNFADFFALYSSVFKSNDKISLFPLANGKREILSLDLNTLEYRAKKSAKFETLELTKSIDNVADRFKVLVAGKDKAGEFYRKSFAAMFAYVQNRIPEISDELYRIDDGLRAGFGWEHGHVPIQNQLLNHHQFCTVRQKFLEFYFEHKQT